MFHGSLPQTAQKVAWRGGPHHPRPHHCFRGQCARRQWNRVLVAWETCHSLGWIGGRQPKRRHQCGRGVSARRVGALWVARSNSFEAGLAGLARRLLVHSALWRTQAMGLQMVVANIELAASQGCTLVVYYFNGMKGKGKVENFTTAGEEHMRREAICRCKDAFLQSDSFKDALKAGLKHLSKETGPDSSSPYSREEHRLFLAALE